MIKGSRGEQFGQFSFGERPGSGAFLKNNAGEMVEVSDEDYGTWRSAKKAHYEKHGPLGDASLIGPNDIPRH